jgi:hypothetical protein
MYIITSFTPGEKQGILHPEPPSKHHLPFDRLTALSKAEGPFDRPFGI